jgi:DNA-binding NarL/FixJ family response regulator
MVVNPFSHRPENGPAAAKKRSVLLIDDDPVVLITIQHLLQRHRPGWDVRTAADGHEGLTALNEHAFDAVISDMCMSGLHGLAVLAEVQQRYPSIARIALTAHIDEQWKVEHNACVAQVLILKPCTSAELIRAIERPHNVGSPGASRFDASTSASSRSADQQKRHTHWDDDEIVTFG